MTLETWLLCAVFAQFALITTVGTMSGLSRFKAVREGVRVKDIALKTDAWPEEQQKRGNNFNNQFQLPILFMALVGLLLARGQVDMVHVALAWTFVLSRILHSYIHIGSNHVLSRFRAYLVGFAVLSLMWIWFAVQTLILN